MNLLEEHFNYKKILFVIDMQNIYCYKDCCVGISKEAHEVVLKVMQSCQIEIF